MSTAVTLRELVIDQASGSYTGLAGELWLLPETGDSRDKAILKGLELVEPVAGLGPVILRLFDVNALAREAATITFSAQPADTNLLTYTDPYHTAVIFEYDSTGAFTAGRQPVLIGSTFYETARNTYLAILRNIEDGVMPGIAAIVPESITLGAAGVDTHTLTVTDGTTTYIFELDNNGAWTAGNIPVPIGGTAAATTANLLELLKSCFPNNELVTHSIDPAAPGKIWIHGVQCTVGGATFTVTRPIVTFRTLLPGSTAQHGGGTGLFVAGAASPVVATAGGAALPGAVIAAEYGLYHPGDILEVNRQFDGGIFAQVTTGANARVKLLFEYMGQGRLSGRTYGKSTAQY